VDKEGNDDLHQLQMPMLRMLKIVDKSAFAWVKLQVEAEELIEDTSKAAEPHSINEL